MNTKLTASGITLILLPYMAICVLPHLLGVTSIKPEWLVFRTILDITLSAIFVGNLSYLIYISSKD